LLLIDEGSLLRELERSFARREGYELATVENGRELLSRASAEGADLIIVPMILPDMTCSELCALLRSSGRWTSIPVLAIGPAAAREGAAAAGANVFLALPWTRHDLVSAMRSLFPALERGASRARVSVKVVCGDGNESYVAFTKDVSATGLFLKGAALAAPGTILRLQLRLPGGDEEVQVSAEVVRRETQNGASGRTPGVGVRFLDFPMIRKLPITRFVREHSAE
jgi:uncharacterized protein (TIGR02266 family)